MSVKKQKYYVVWQGHHPGIYTSWNACSQQVKNFPNARYQSFTSRQEAEEAFRSGPVMKEKKIPSAKQIVHRKDIIAESLSVDAACSGNPGMMEYQGVWTSDKTPVFHFGPVPNGTNNIGEFLAIVHALAWLQKKDKPLMPVYTDSKTAISWVKHKKAKTKLKEDASNHKLFDMIRRAERWLQTNTWNNPLLKWETEQWGEIPADFDRK